MKYSYVPFFTLKSCQHIASKFLSTYDIVGCGPSQQSAKSDDRGDASYVHENEGRYALDTKGVCKIAQEIRHLCLDVIDQTAKEPAKVPHTFHRDGIKNKNIS